jgi:hypothetical protein
MGLLDPKQLKAISHKLVCFAEAFRSLTSDHILKALSRQALLSEHDKLEALVVRSLIILIPEWTLREEGRRLLWSQSKKAISSDNQAFAKLKSILEDELRNPDYAHRYIFPEWVLVNKNLRAYLAMQAREISEAIGNALSTKEARAAIQSILKRYAGPDRQKSSATLKIRVLRHELRVGESSPIEVYLSAPSGLRNMTTRAHLEVQPSYRAEIKLKRLIALAPGRVRVVVQAQGERAELDLFVKAAREQSDPEYPKQQDNEMTDEEVSRAETTPMEAPAEELAAPPAGKKISAARTLFDRVPTPIPLELPKLTSRSPPANRPTPYDQAMTASEQPKLVSADETPTKMLSGGFVPKSKTERPQRKPPAGPGDELVRSDPDQLSQQTVFEPATGKSTALFLGGGSNLAQTRRLGSSPLVFSLVVIPPLEIGESYGLTIDGEESVPIGLIFLQHFLLRPGARTINIELHQHGRCIAMDTLEIQWNLPGSADDSRPEFEDTPPLCLEMFWRFEKDRSKQRSRLRILATSRFVSLAEGDSGQELRMFRKPGNVYSGGIDLEAGHRSISFLGRSGQHSVDLLIKRDRARWC